MPPSDQEPRYRLVDSNDNVVGALWADSNGNVKIADETDTQTTFGPDGISTPALDANKSATVSGWPMARGLDQDSIADINEFDANNKSISADAYETIFSVSEARFVFGGEIEGPFATNLRITWGDGTTDTIFANPAGGSDGSGNLHSAFTIPALRYVKKLEFKNDAGATESYGYRVITT